MQIETLWEEPWLEHFEWLKPMFNERSWKTSARPQGEGWDEGQLRKSGQQLHKGRRPLTPASPQRGEGTRNSAASVNTCYYFSSYSRE